MLLNRLSKLAVGAMILTLWFAPAQQVHGQELVQLVADEITSDAEQIIATGNVEILYQGEYVRAQKMVYNKSHDYYYFEGDVFYDDGSGLVVLADDAMLSKNLSDGILRSTRFLMNDSLQITSQQILRAEGRYSEMEKVRASSCKVCKNGATPLWEVRATRAVHDKMARRIYYQNFQLRIGGLPVFYSPRLRMPEPSVDRATGFLTPKMGYSTLLGGGFRWPFFIAINPYSDLQISPYITTDGNSNNATIAYRKAFPKADLTINSSLSYGDAGPLSFDGSTASVLYIQPYRTGNVSVESTVSFDQTQTTGVRARYRATGNFNLPKKYKLDFLFDGVIGDYYLFDDNYTDRMYSNMSVSRINNNQYLDTDLITFRSVRPGEVNSTIPSLIWDNNWQQRFYEPLFGGSAGIKFNIHSEKRSSTVTTNSNPTVDNISDGRDTNRFSLAGDWRRNWFFNNGMVGSLAFLASADYFNVNQDDNFGDANRITGVGSVELRWPFTATDRWSGQQVIEPTIQYVLAPTKDYGISNEDSTLVEFDEGSLFSIQRFAGYDDRERGDRLNFGISWTRLAPEGWSIHTDIGKVLRPKNYDQFSDASGLAQINSDLLTSTRLSLANGLSVQNRVLLGSNFNIEKNELRLAVEKPKFGLSASYVSLQRDTYEGRAEDVNEIYLASRLNLSDQWTANVNSRFNFEENTPVNTNLNLSYLNECLRFNLAFTRRHTSSVGFDPNTDFSLDMELLGFSNGSSRGNARQCGM